MDEVETKIETATTKIRWIKKVWWGHHAETSCSPSVIWIENVVAVAQMGKNK